MAHKKVECLLRDEFTLEGMFSEEDIKAYFSKACPSLAIKEIKTSVNKDLSIKAIIHSNVLAVLNSNYESDKQTKFLKEPSLLSTPGSNKISEERIEDQGKLIQKYIKGIKKNSEGGAESIEKLTKLFDNMEIEIEKWRKMLNVPAKEGKTNSQLNSDEVKKIKEETESQYMMIIQLMKTQIEEIDAAKTAAETAAKDARNEKDDKRANSFTKQAGGSDKLVKKLENAEKKEKDLMDAIKKLESQLTQEKHKNEKERAKSVKEEENTPSDKAVDNQYKQDNDKLNNSILLLEKKNNDLINSTNSLRAETYDLKAKIAAKEKAIASLQEEVKASQLQCTQLTTLKSNIELRLNETKTSTDELSKARQQNDTTKSELEESKIRVAKLMEENNQVKKKAIDFEEQLAVINNQSSKASTQLTEKEEYISKSNAERNTLNEKLKSTMSNLEILKQTYENSNKEKVLLNEKIKLLQEKIEDMKALKDEQFSKYKEIENQKAKNDETIRKLVADSYNADLEAHTCNAKLQALNTTIEEHNKKHQEMAAQIKALNDNNNSIKSQLDSALLERKEIESKYNTLNSQYSALNTNNQTALTTINNANQKVKEQEGMINALQKENEQFKQQTQTSTDKYNDAISKYNNLLQEQANSTAQSKKVIESLTIENTQLKKMMSDESIKSSTIDQTLQDLKNKCQQQSNTIKELEAIKEKYMLLQTQYTSMITESKESINKCNAQAQENTKKYDEASKANITLKEENSTLKDTEKKLYMEIQSIKEMHSNEILTKNKELQSKEMDLSYYKGLSEVGKDSTQNNIEEYKADIESLKKMLETKDSMFESINKRYKETEAKLNADITAHKKEIENTERQYITQIQELQSKLTNAEISTIQTQSITNGQPTDDKISNLMKENTDLQIKHLASKSEKDKVLSENTYIKKQCEKMQLDIDILNSKLKSITQQHEELSTQYKLQLAQNQESIKTIKEKEAQIANASSQLLQVKEMSLQQNNSLHEYSDKIKDLEHSLSDVRANTNKKFTEILSKIIIYPSTPLWVEGKQLPENNEEIITLINQTVAKSDKEGRVSETQHIIKELMDSQSSIITISQSIMEKLGCKCDNINLIIDSRKLYEEGSKEYQMVALKKFKAVIPFMKDINFDLKNKDLLLKAIYAYIEFKQKRLCKLTEEFGKYRKISISFENKRKEIEQLTKDRQAINK